jgi:hypothetical protein
MSTHVYNPTSHWHMRYDLTKGKQYECTWNQIVYSSDDDARNQKSIYYSLINDLGNLIEVHESHLIPLEEWRSKRLIQIGL